MAIYAKAKRNDKVSAGRSHESRFDSLRCRQTCIESTERVPTSANRVRRKYSQRACIFPVPSEKTNCPTRVKCQGSKNDNVGSLFSGHVHRWPQLKVTRVSSLQENSSLTQVDRYLANSLNIQTLSDSFIWPVARVSKHTYGQY